MAFEFSSPLLLAGSAAPSHGLNIPPQLEQLGIDLPDALTAHRAHLAKLTKRVKSVGDSHEIEQRIVAALEADADASLDEGLMAVATVGLQGQALRLAEFNGWITHGQILLHNADDLIAAMGREFAKDVDEIAPLVDLDTIDLAALAAQERTDDVLAVARADKALARIRKLRKLRRLLILDVGRAMHLSNRTLDRYGALLSYRNPDRVGDDTDTLAALVDNIRADAGPWLATLPELEARRIELAPPDPIEVVADRSAIKRQRAAVV